MSEFLIDKILPAREVHLIGGPSGSGKTTWILQTLVEKWQKGEDVLGFKSFPAPWLYVSSDRSLKSVHATLSRLGISPTQFRLISAVDQGIFSMDTLLKACALITPRPELIYIDGFLNMTPDNVLPNDNKKVGKWLAELTRRCEKEGFTVWGALHSPKMKKDERYDNPRQRIAGGASWAGFSDSVFLVEPVSPDDPDQANKRRLTVCSRNYSEIYVDLVFNSQGRLVEVEEDLSEALFYAHLSSIKPGSTFTTESVLIVLNGYSRRLIAKHLAKATEQGIIENAGHGRWRVTDHFQPMPGSGFPAS